MTSLVSLIGCATEEIDKETRIQTAIEDKVVDYRKTELKRCIDGVKLKAEAEVDSVLRKMSKQQKIDTISPPSRFTRPRQPDLQFKKFEKPQPIKVDTNQ